MIRKQMTGKRLLAVILIVVFSPVSLCFSQNSQSQNRGYRSEKTILRVGYPAGVVDRGVLEDMQISLQAWGTSIVKRATDIIDKVDAIIFDDHSEFLNALKRKEIDMIVLNTLDYIELEDLKYMEPIFVGFTDQKVGQEYVLLVRFESGIASVKQLKNGTILIDEEIVGLMPHYWLEVLLWNEGIQDKSAFFNKIDSVNKASQAVLPVFFGNALACVTTKRAFLTMSELNPQLEQQLAILEVSPAFLRGLFVFRKDLETDIKKKIIDVMQTFHEDPDGQQILMLLKEERLISFQPEYLVDVRKLYEDYQRINSEKLRISKKND